jgi:hypothetical protein
VPFINTSTDTDGSAHMPAAVTKSELFDVYSTHTKDCIHCMKGIHISATITSVPLLFCTNAVCLQYAH